MDSLVNRSDFPSDFIFGVASSAYQFEGAAEEGGRGPSIWDDFTKRFPGIVKDYSDGKDGVHHYLHYKEDIQIMKKLGINSFRLSFSWSRILPGGKLDKGVNRDGIKFYNNLIDELWANGIEPSVTLFHFDLPQALDNEYKGFMDRKIVDDFRDYAELCFWEFGDRVKHWITMNEPFSYINCGYVMGVFPPGRGQKKHDPKTYPRLRGFRWSRVGISAGDPSREPYKVAHHMLLAHAAAVQVYKTKFQPAQGGTIGITNISPWVEPLDVNSNDDKAAARRAVDFISGWFIEPVVKGKYPKSMREIVGSRLPTITEDDKKLLVGSYDFLGINYYTGMYAKNAPPDSKSPEGYNKDVQAHFQNDRYGDYIGPKAGNEWLYVYPEGLYNLLLHLKNDYNDPVIYITENGYCEDTPGGLTLSKARKDSERKDYHEKHLQQLTKAISAQVKVKGYYVWSLFDNFEWMDGYATRFGMFFVDLHKGMIRYPKDSALWYMNFLKSKPKKHESSEKSNDTGGAT